MCGAVCFLNSNLARVIISIPRLIFKLNCHEKMYFYFLSDTFINSIFVQ